MKKNIFITSTLPYPNSESGPHIGFMFEIFQLDFLKKYLEIEGNEVFLNTGLDEEGLKIYRKAKTLGLTPIEYLEKFYKNYIHALDVCGISYNTFYRTSDKSHSLSVRKIWRELYDKGDIYLKEYDGLYCVGCESFKTNQELIENKCDIHPHLDIEKVSEENYFFRLERYKEDIKEYVLNNNFITDRHKKELVNQISDTKDISISRLKTSNPWGTEVPNDGNHTIYVWFSALCNYIISAGYYTNNFNWSNVIQSCGVDNIRFQGIIFQSILRALGIKFTDVLLVHGTILDNEGNKMSKSVGNTIDPIDQLDKFGLIPLKYYLLKGLHTFNNSNFDEKALIDTYNSDLADNYGNLISRVVHLINTKKYDDLPATDEYIGDIEQRINDIRKNLIKNWDIQSYFVEISKILKDQNQYINEEEPWKEDKPQVLFNILYVLQQVTELYKPLLGEDKIEEVLESINKREKKVLFEKIK